MTDVEAPAEGWASLVNARKHHYFVGTESLCGHWMRFTVNFDLSEQGGHSAQDCVACTRKLAKREESKK